MRRFDERRSPVDADRRGHRRRPDHRFRALRAAVGTASTWRTTPSCGAGRSNTPTPSGRRSGTTSILRRADRKPRWPTRRCRVPGGFPGAKLNYVDQVERSARSDRPAIVSIGEDGTDEEISWPALIARTASLAHTLRERGVGPGRPGGRVSAERARDRRRVPRDRQPGRGVERLRAGLLREGGAGPPGPTRAQRPDRRRRLPLRRQGARPQRVRSPSYGPVCPPSARPSSSTGSARRRSRTR